MKRRLLVAVALLLVPAAARAAEAVLLSENGCGRATAYAEANKIVTVGDRTHVAWLDSTSEGFRARIRTLDRRTGRWSPVHTIGKAHDNHGGPALTVDSRGHLHVAYYPHHHPMRYRRSVRPNDASEWTEPQRVGARCTYPTLVCGARDTLYLTCRQSRSDGPWTVGLYTRAPGGSWEGPTPLIRARYAGYAHFQEALAWGPDHRTLHLACRIYEDKGGRRQTVAYMVSPDAGRTWRRSDGTAVPLPATAETMDVLASKKGPGETGAGGLSLRCGALAVDPRGTPHVLYSSADRHAARLLLATPDGRKGWHRRTLNPAMADLWPDAGLTMPGSLSISADGRIVVAAAAFPPEAVAGGKAWGHPAMEVVRMVSGGGGRTFHAALVAPRKTAEARWLPNLERATGHNRVGFPGLIYTSGGPGEKNTDILSNRVWWVPPPPQAAR